MHKYTLLYIVLCLGGLASLCAKPKSSIPDSLQVLHFEVNGVPFDMQRVEGGVFVMGGTYEQSGWNCTCLAPSFDNSGEVQNLGGSTGAKSFLDAPYTEGMHRYL